MIAPDETVVKASFGFWENLLAKQFQFKNYFEVFEIKDDEIIIKSDDSKDVLEAIMKLSKEYPQQIFHVKTDSKDRWNNYVQLYECQNGTSKLVNETKELIEFKKKLVEFYRKIDQPNPKKIHMSLGFEKDGTEGDLNNDELSYTVTYTTKDTRYTAIRNGMTYIMIEVEAYNSIF
jgi:hypothetical protein